VSSCPLKTDRVLKQDYERNIASMDQKLLSIGLVRPALRCLCDHGIFSLENLNELTVEELSSWHGIGPKAIQTLMPYLKKLNYKDE